MSRADGDFQWDSEIIGAGHFALDDFAERVFLGARAVEKEFVVALQDHLRAKSGGSDCAVDVDHGKLYEVCGAALDGGVDGVALSGLASGGVSRVDGAQSAAANRRLTVAQCYILGLAPEEPESDFRIVSFPMKADGTPDFENVTFDPPQSEWNVPEARPVLKGKTTLQGANWQTVTD